MSAHYDTMFRVAWRFAPNTPDAEDITHEACIKLARSIRQYRAESRFTTWLYRLVVNCAHDWRKRNQRHTPVDPDSGDEPFTHGNAESSATLTEVLNRIEDEGAEFLETVVLVIAEGMTHAEAAEILGVKESTISWRLHEVRKRLESQRNGTDG